MRKPFYKNKLTGNYGFLEDLEVQILPNPSYYLRLKLVQAVDGMIESSYRTENVKAENLLRVSREDVLLGLYNPIAVLDECGTPVGANAIPPY